MSDDQATTETPGKTSADDESGRPRSWRDDALSVFLIAAALLLGAMYVYDQWQASRIDEQVQRAHAIDQSFAVDGTDCQVSSTGLAGETLVVACPGLEARKVAGVAATVDKLKGELPHFDSVVFRGATTQLRCPPEPESWVEACDEEKVPHVSWHSPQPGSKDTVDTAQMRGA